LAKVKLRRAQHEADHSLLDCQPSPSALAKDGKPFLIKEPKLMLNDNDAGKPEVFI
jgi:hypothetical protein